MAWKDWIETATEKARERIILGVFALIALLSLAIWRAVPSSAWDTISEATPKRALWALLGLAAIVIGLETALFLDYRRSNKHTILPEKPKRMLGILWDEDANPLCAVCQTLLHLFYIDLGPGKASRETLRCPKCKAEYILLSDDGERHDLVDVKRYLRGETETIY